MMQDKHDPAKTAPQKSDDGSAKRAEDHDAVERQSNVSPDDYPHHDGGKPDYGSPHKSDPK